MFLNEPTVNRVVFLHLSGNHMPFIILVICDVMIFDATSVLRIVPRPLQQTPTFLRFSYQIQSLIHTKVISRMLIFIGLDKV